MEEDDIFWYPTDRIPGFHVCVRRPGGFNEVFSSFSETRPRRCFVVVRTQ
jgi:hypothetical protein